MGSKLKNNGWKDTREGERGIVLKDRKTVRILNVIGGGRIGGAEMFLYSFLTEMVKYRQFSVDVCFMMTRGPVADLISGLEIKTYCLGMKTGFDLAAAMKLRRLINERRYEIVHSHTGQLLTWLAMSLSSAPVKIITEHGDAISGTTFKKKVQYYFLKTMFHSYKNLVVVSEHLKKTMTKKYQLPASKVLVIRSGVDLKCFPSSIVGVDEQRRKLGLPIQGSIVGTVGRLVPVKGIDHLISAAPIILTKYPDCLFLIVGDGPLRQVLELKVKSAYLSRNFKFLGERDDISELLSVMDLLIFPSVMEGLPVAAIEGMAMGKPIVAYGVGGIPEIVTRGVTGLLVEQRVPALLAENILTLLGDERLRLAMGTEARKVAAKEFCIDSVAKKYAELYLHSLKNNKFCSL